MDSENKILIISHSDSFLAKSLITKLSGAGLNADFSKAGLKELEQHTKGMALAILFMSEELDGVPESLVYLKDIIQDKELGLIVIGDEEGFEIV
ncbi:MAG: hypothetical protein IKQ28_05545, partial [Lachnospiraceae bacterium]|nr:hypothetical protein [Lachnospiraceae bacterium]